MNEQTIKSTLTKTSKVKLVRSIEVDLIKKSYSSNNVDVDRFFNDLDTIDIYECIDTGYRFYYPLNTAGDDRFYADLALNDWYYMPWKWEHQITNDLIIDGMKVLEIGCARGDFLKNISTEHNVEVLGIELNKSAAQIAAAKGINILVQDIKEIADKYDSYFDIVCTFQVVEHIAAIQEFLINAIKVLKKGGTLIISVPNNESYIKNLFAPLNMPPHHMGLWTEKSLTNLASLFNLQIKQFHREPLQKYHRDNYANSLINKFLKSETIIKKTIRWFMKIIVKIIYQFVGRKIIGHTLLFEYKKL